MTKRDVKKNSNLTDEQQGIVNAQDNPVFVSAGAGTGKTYTLVHRLAEMLEGDEGDGVDPARIMAITFTEAAAGELKARARRAVSETGGDDAQRIQEAWISTIHSMCRRFLAENAVELGIDIAVDVDESNRQKRSAKENAAYNDIVKKTTVGCRFDEEWTRANREAVINDVRAFVVDDVDFGPAMFGQRGDPISKMSEEIRQAYGYDANGNKDKRGWTADVGSTMSFDDLISKTCEALCSNESGLRKDMQSRFAAIMVDEFQDTDPEQIEIIKQLCGGDLSKLCCVGDKQQSIYRFRGAEVSVSEQMRDDMVQATDCASEDIDFPLSGNFRSHPDILSFVSGLFYESEADGEGILGKERDLLGKSKALFGDSGGVELEPAKDKNGESAFKDKEGYKFEDNEPRIRLVGIGGYDKATGGANSSIAKGDLAKSIATEFANIHSKNKVPYGDMALLMRTYTDLEEFTKAFDEKHIPWAIVGGSRFYEFEEIKSLLSAMNGIVKADDDDEFKKLLLSPVFSISGSEVVDALRSYRKWRRDQPKHVRGSAYEYMLDNEGVRERCPGVARMADYTAYARQERLLSGTASDFARWFVETSGYKERILYRYAKKGKTGELEEDKTGPGRYANVCKLFTMLDDESKDALDNGIIPDSTALVIMKHHAIAKAIQDDKESRRFGADREKDAKASYAHGENDDCVSINTIHSAKGLEYGVVAVYEGVTQPKTEGLLVLNGPSGKIGGRKLSQEKKKADDYGLKIDAKDLECSKWKETWKKMVPDNEQINSPIFEGAKVSQAQLEKLGAFFNYQNTDFKEELFKNKTLGLSDYMHALIETEVHLEWEEKKRILYVALTRAKSLLVWCGSTCASDPNKTATTDINKHVPIAKRVQGCGGKVDLFLFETLASFIPPNTDTDEVELQPLVVQNGKNISNTKLIDMKGLLAELMPPKTEPILKSEGEGEADQAFGLAYFKHNGRDIPVCISASRIKTSSDFHLPSFSGNDSSRALPAAWKEKRSDKHFELSKSNPSNIRKTESFSSLNGRGNDTFHANPPSGTRSDGEIARASGRKTADAPAPASRQIVRDEEGRAARSHSTALSDLFDGMVAGLPDMMAAIGSGTAVYEKADNGDGAIRSVSSSRRASSGFDMWLGRLCGKPVGEWRKSLYVHEDKVNLMREVEPDGEDENVLDDIRWAMVSEEIEETGSLMMDDEGTFEAGAEEQKRSAMAFGSAFHKLAQIGGQGGRSRLFGDDGAPTALVGEIARLYGLLGTISLSELEGVAEGEKCPRYWRLVRELRRWFIDGGDEFEAVLGIAPGQEARVKCEAGLQFELPIENGDEDRNLHMRGIIDVLREERDEDGRLSATIWDYKTGYAGRASEDVAAHYRKQLELYAYGLLKTGRYDEVRAGLVLVEKDDGKRLVCGDSDGGFAWEREQCDELERELGEWADMQVNKK